MKILLTSDGLTSEKICQKLIEETPIIETKKVYFIDIAAINEDQKIKAKNHLQKLKNLGFKNIEIVSNFKSYQNFLKNSVVFVCGGNTFHLAKEIFQGSLKNLLQNFNGIYIGVSAGSILAGKNISFASPWDKNLVSWQSMKGLNLVEKIIIPHSGRKSRELLDNQTSGLSEEIIKLSDGQALWIDDKKEFIL